MEIQTEWFYAPGKKAPVVLTLFAGGDVIPNIRRVRVVCFCDTKVVLIYESQNNEWSFPGGKVEDGETPEEGAQREVLEESGRVVTTIKPLGVVRVTSPEGMLHERLWFVAEVAPGSLGAVVDPAGDVTSVMECEAADVQRFIPWLPSVEQIAAHAAAVLAR
ncbi:MAG: nucleoside triphosphatase YtkD [Candidatus Parcubacteria bacterium]|jgi:8-oxo-dGTP pyrophosphatase MutT (NUDIX family)